MKSDERKINLPILFHAFEKPYSFYVLGAGASAGIIPMTSELKSNSIDRFFQHGSFPVDPCPIDEIFQRVIGDPNEFADSYTAARLMRFYPSAVHAIIAKELASPVDTANFDAYKIFLLIKRPSTIFSMNVDGIASRYCIGHYLLEPHGRIPAKLVLAPWWDELIDALLEFGFKAPQIPGLLLPQPEPVYITSNLAYDKAIQLFQAAEFIVFIGYSFGFFREFFDDLETFEFFRDLLRHNPKKVIFLSPNPEFIANAIEEATKIKANLLPLYWNHLCKAIKEVVAQYRCNSLIDLKNLMSIILYKHDEIKDREPEPITGIRRGKR